MNHVKSKRGHQFALTPSVSIQRSVFDRSHGLKTTLDAGYLVPIMVDEALPGDSWTCNYQHLMRMTTPIVPFMDNVRASVFFFSVPKRLVWDNFESFITGSVDGKYDPGSAPAPVQYPQMVVRSSTGTEAGYIGDIADYMGIPPVVPVSGNDLSVTALPFRAYNLIYNDWFRDENLTPSVNVRTGDTGDVMSDYTLLKRCKRRDYFTSCLPWPQKGPVVDLPLGGSAIVKSQSDVAALNNVTTFAQHGISSSAGATAALWIDNGKVTGDLNLIADLPRHPLRLSIVSGPRFRYSVSTSAMPVVVRVMSSLCLVTLVYDHPIIDFSVPSTSEVVTFLCLLTLFQCSLLTLVVLFLLVDRF